MNINKQHSNKTDKKMYYLTILDHESATVHQYDLLDYNEEEELSTWKTENFENFLVSESYRLSHTDWMFHSDNKIYKY